MSTAEQSLQQERLVLDEYFGMIRATLQEPPSSSGWDIIINRIVYGPSKDWMHEETIQKFDAELLPYINSSLDAWPDELRVVKLALSEHDHPMESYHDLGRIVRVRKDFSMQAKTQLKRDVANLKHTPSLVGFYLEGVSKYLPEHLHAYCSALSLPLQHVHIDINLPHPRAREKRGEFREDVLREAITSLLETHGETLVALGLNVDKNASTMAADALWEPVLQHAQKLTNLRHLYIGCASGTKDWGASILKHPAFDQLDTLAECSANYRIPDQAIMNREASQNLKRLRVYGRSEALNQALILSENLCHLDVAELLPLDYPDYTDQWGTKVAQHWKQERQRLMSDA